MSNTTIQTNEHVNLTIKSYGYEFTPDEGYAMWRDDEEGNLNPETGEPYMYFLTIIAPASQAEAIAPHIWARLIDDTMEVYGNGNHVEVMSNGEATVEDYQEALAKLGVDLNED